MAKRLIFFILACFLITSLSGQSWRKLRKTAEEQFEEGNYADAAENYEAAWQKKQKKEELIYKAGESYYLIRDYRNAAQAYQHVKDQYDDYPLVGLKYARALKQDGQYDKAIQAFREFSQNYTGQGKAILEEIIRTEIRGAELAQQLASQMDTDLKISHLGPGINSDANEFSPLPFSSNILYFSSTMGEKARIYRSQRTQTGWEKASIPENFPVIQGDHFANGTLTPDGSRFYFTICGSEENNFNTLSTRCEIYVIKRISGTWSQPERLPDNVNLDGTTSTQPFVVHEGGTEYLYFSSNRGGGRGGLDLWYTTRELATDNLNFTNPVNLGPTINTLGDEMSPFIDVANNKMYFASNGHTSIGGFDIFSSQGSTTSWAIPENIGMPYNSSADDFYYAQKADNSGGFFASNRIFAGDKLTTTNDDIFEFGSQSFQPVLEATVFDRATNELLENFTVTVYEVDPSGQENLLYNRPFTGGNYTFDLPPGGTYRIEVASPGFETQSYTVFANDPQVSNYGQTLFLDEDGAMAVESNEPEMAEEPVMPQPDPEMPAGPEGTEVLDKGGAIYTSRGLAPGDQYEFTTSAPRYAGTYYKVQIVSLQKYNENEDTFPDLMPYGENLTTEYVSEKAINRILLGPYFTDEAARAALEQVHFNGYPKAFLVRYDDGQRYGRVNLQ